MNKIGFFQITGVMLLSALLISCSTNPVTGKREVSFVSTSAQIQMGEENYLPSQQSQGGQYYLDPELNEYVSEVNARLVEASKVVFPDAPNLPYEIVVLNNDVPNAWAMPGGKMAINRGLLVELKNESELAAVLGHEIVHAAAGHSAAQMSRGTLLNAGLAMVGIATSGSEYGDLINYGSQIGSAAWMASYGRDDELESDHYGMMIMSEAGCNPQGAVTLQEEFVRMSEGRNQGFIDGLFASHPPSQDRVDANRAFVEQLPPGGTVGEDRYQAAIAQLIHDADAYEAQNKATAALNDKKPEEALELLDTAISIQPDEGQFWELRGHAWRMNKNDANAERAYTTAIEKNPNYYRHWLARGLLRKEQGKISEARADLERGEQLLPTATGSYLLGNLAEQRGDMNSALQYYQSAASSGGEVGQAAQMRLIRHDLPANPGNYIASGIRLMDSGEIVAVVRNDSGLEVNSVQVQLTDLLTGAYQIYNVGGRLAPGNQAATGTGVVGNPANFQVRVVAARVN